MLVYEFLVVENVIQLKDPRFTDVVGVICSNVEEEDGDEEEEEDDEEEEEEAMGELTLTILGLLLMIDSKGNEIAEMSAAVVSTGTENVSSTS